MAKKRPMRISASQMNRYGFASEVAWRLLAIDYQKTLDDILCSPEFAREFDRLAAMFGPDGVASTEYRRAALSIRKRTKPARESGAIKFASWVKRKLRPISIDDCRSPKYDIPGVFLIRHGGVGIYAGESENMRQHVEIFLANPNWQGLEPDSIVFEENNQSFVEKYAHKSALIKRLCPPLNCRLWVEPTELPA
jgi:hypothetical protein